MWIPANITVNATFSIQIEEGTEFTGYEEYGAMPSTEFPSPVKCVGDNVNYFNKDTVTEGKYLTYQGQEVANTVWTYSDFISCTPNENWIISGYNTIGGAPARCFYNKDKELISGGAHNSQKSMMSFTTPDNCYYFRDSIAKADIDTVKIEKGDTSTSYSKFGEGSTEIKKVNKNILQINTDYFEYTERGIKRNSTKYDGATVTTFKIKKGQKIKIGLLLFTKPTTSTTFSFYEDGTTNSIYGFNNINNNTLNQIYEKEYTATEDVELSFRLWGNSNNEEFEFQLWAELNELTDYEQHKEQNYTLTIQQEMLSGDYFDLENGKEVHKFIKKKITSADGWFIGSNPNQETTLRLVSNCSVPGLSADKINAYSNYFPAKTANYLWNNEEIGVAQSQSQLIIRVEKSEFPDISSFNNFIDTHDVYIYYTAPEPIELDLTEEQSTILEQLSNMKAYEGETNIFSTDETSPIFKITAVQKASALLTQVNDLNNKIAQLSQQILEIAGGN